MKDRIRRSRLYIPGNNPSIMQNIAVFGADTITLDLEDAVAPSEKDAARILVKYCLKNVDFGRSERGVRINPLNTPFGKEDLDMVLSSDVDILFLPKTESAEDVLELCSLIGDTEIWISPIIETAKGVLNSYEIASADARVVMLCFGAEDFTKDIGAERTKDGMELFWARSMIVMGAKAAGIQASDTVFSDINDMEGLIREAEFARSIGFDGKGLIHPSQIEPVHSVFSPSSDEIEYAKKVVDAMREAEEKGMGVIALGRKMIDKPVLERAKRVLKMAEELGLLEVRNDRE